MNAEDAPKLRHGDEVDVMLVLEGTYPFVSGGVSSWVHQIIQGLPDLTFGIVFIGGSPEPCPTMRYSLPPNVRHLETHFLAEVAIPPRPRHRAADARFLRAAADMHDALEGSDGHAPVFEQFIDELCRDPERHERDFLYSEESWNEITRRYRESAAGQPFTDYFWTVRSMHAPIFKLAKLVRSLPRARSFHVISTGYAGFTASLASRLQRKPLILTEHGIYTKERRIELTQAAWVSEGTPGANGASRDLGFFRRLWIRFFEGLAKITYASANPIITLFEGNRVRQINDGADPARTLVIPNGIDLRRFGGLRARREGSAPPVLALIGRVVPIKDIKTFARAMRSVLEVLPEAEGWIVGPAVEDERYAHECRDLIFSLGIEQRVKLLGLRNVDDILPRAGILVLTSISEAMPLVLLEGFAAGVPCVTTDVGCARELVFGRTAEDRALGAAGAVVDIADPQATARAALSLLSDPSRWRAAQAAGAERVAAYYDQTLMLERYRTIYARALEATWRA